MYTQLLLYGLKTCSDNCASCVSTLQVENMEKNFVIFANGKLAKILHLVFDDFGPGHCIKMCIFSSC